MTKWDSFFKEKTIDIFTTSTMVLDIGEGLRARSGTGNTFDKNRAWLQDYIKKVKYVVMDVFPEFKPDIVGDIHNIPLQNESVDAILCLAVLEHVHDPIRAMAEMYRVLKPNGKMLIYVPFLYYYHDHKGVYGDYWRFTYDTLKRFAEPYTEHEITPVRLPIETLVRLTPFGRYTFPISLARWLDGIFYSKKNSKQVGGYYLYLRK
jgi:ubiquinone/menaquinone biosynthesis C-methylase UbiE